MRKFFTALVLIPLGLIFVVFAVANRHLVTVSFDPFNSSDPSVGVTLPLFVVIIAVAIAGVVAGGSATWIRHRHGLAAGSAAPVRPVAGRVWGRRARQAGRDVVERGPRAGAAFAALSRFLQGVP